MPCKALERRVLDVRGAKSNVAGRRNSPVLTVYTLVNLGYETKNYAVYVILGYDVDGQKDILGLWLSESESKHQWMQIFDEIKNRGVEDVLFLSMDGVSGLEEGAKAIFPHVTVQRCMRD